MENNIVNFDFKEFIINFQNTKLVFNCCPSRSKQAENLSIQTRRKLEIRFQCTLFCNFLIQTVKKIQNFDWKKIRFNVCEQYKIVQIKEIVFFRFKFLESQRKKGSQFKNFCKFKNLEDLQGQKKKLEPIASEKYYHLQENLWYFLNPSFWELDQVIELKNFM
eukprot:TRINITY_DN10542_c0_g1_i12.p5 TRINITY_DN10542_c0_g1~~TRINITY_DN10542_c0_g1_i12.p5  ORF type:complete len:163 (-),score=5.30 TRINITY_DN10542_c0_g1_i12:122-610(-)